MKLKRILATLLLLATLTACAPSGEPTATAEPTVEPTAAVEMNYYRYTGASSFYPLWAQPNSEYVYTENRYGNDRKFIKGGYLTREEIEGREDIAAEGLYSTAAEYFAQLNTKAVYDENGHLGEILYLYSDGEYHADPPEGDDIPTLPPEDVHIQTSDPLYLTDVGSADMSYEEYFSVPRYVEPYYNNPRDMAYRQLYEMTPEIEEMLAPYDIISLVHGNQIVLFFMTADYKIYRLHVPSGTVDFMCDTAFDFEAGLKGYEMYILNNEWEGYQDTRRMIEVDYETFVEYWGVEEVERIANDDASYSEWAKRDHTEDIEHWCSQAKEYMPMSGYFEVLSNNDVRFTVMGDSWLPIEPDIGYDDTDWFSHVVFGSGSYFYGDYVTYSAALGKFGGPWRALDLLGIPSEQWMTYDEFCDYYGGTPPHSGI